MPAAEGQTALVSLEKRVKGKVVTLVRGLTAHADDLAALAKKLKARCGAGGTERDGVIEVQGDHRETIAAALEAMGYAVRRKG
jgi:translation initiation factor 1